VHIRVNIRPKQEVEPKVGGGPTFRSGPSFVRVQYYVGKACLHAAATSVHIEADLCSTIIMQ
jgi:hypothetical protein